MAWLRRSILAAGGLALSAIGSGDSAAAAIAVPDCPALVAFGAGMVPRDTTPINALPSRTMLPTAFTDRPFTDLFGTPALDWTAADMALAANVVKDCAAAARKARNPADSEALKTLTQGLTLLGATLRTVGTNETRLDAALQTLLAEAPSRALLDTLVIVGSVRDGGAEAMQAAATGLRESSRRLNIRSPAHIQSQSILRLLAELPPVSWEQVFPPVDARIPEVRARVIAEAGEQFAAVPDTIQGLQGLPRLRDKARAELAASLSEAELAGVDAAAEARREAIEAALVAEEVARIDAVAATVGGLNQLRMMERSPIRAAISPAGVAAIKARAAARRAEIGRVVTDAEIAQLDQFPPTLDGLNKVAKYRTDALRGLDVLAGPQEANRFEAAAAARAAAIGEAALKPFRQSLGQLPETEEGLSGLDSAVNKTRAGVESLAMPLRTQYIDAVTKRREQIAAAVAKEDARLAKLSLPGGVFLDRESGAKIEFRNRSRLYLTLFGETTEAEYEVDGDRVIVRLPQGAQVLTRQGPWLRGNGLNLKRQAS